MEQIVADFERAVKAYLPKLSRFKPPRKFEVAPMPRNSYVLGRLVMIGYYDPREDMALKWLAAPEGASGMYLLANKAGTQLMIAQAESRERKDINWDDPELLYEEFKDFHWGREPREVVILRRPRKLAGARYMGPIAVITYETRKGEETLTDYTHAFAWPLPHLVIKGEFPGVVRGTSKFRVEPRGITG